MHFSWCEGIQCSTHLVLSHGNTFHTVINIMKPTDHCPCRNRCISIPKLNSILPKFNEDNVCGTIKFTCDCQNPILR